VRFRAPLQPRDVGMNSLHSSLLDALNQYYSMAEIDVMFEEGCLEIVPLGFMRVALSRIVL
jgi:hypothetical protein